MSLFVVCALLALLELDATHIAQTLISRPLVVGIVLGSFLGIPQAGLALGITFELIGLGSAPVGGHLMFSTTVACGVAVALSAQEASFPLCLAAGVLSGVAHSLIESWERKRRALATDQALLEDLLKHRLGQRAALAIFGHAAITFVISYAGVTAGGLIDRVLWPRLPECIQDGASLAAVSATWFGLSATVVRSLVRA